MGVGRRARAAGAGPPDDRAATTADPATRFQRFGGPQFLEMLPIRPYPMDTSGWMERGVGHMVQRMLAEIPGMHLDFADILPESDGVVDRFVPAHPRLTWKVLGAPARNLPRIRRFRPAEWTRDPRFVRFDRAMRELAAIEVRELPWDELRRLPGRAFADMELVTDLRVDYLPRAGVDLLRLRALQALLRRRDLTGLTLGTKTRTEDANRALLGLAERVRADGALRAVFGLEPQALAERIAQDPAFAGFRTALAEFLDEYGHRETASPLLMSAPTWGEAPATVLGMVKVLAEDAPPAPAGDRAAQAEAQLLAHPLVRLTRSGPRVRRLLADARAGIAFREDSHFHGTRAMPVLRRVVLEAGRRLAAAGVLRAADDVLHLRMEELEHLGDPTTLAPADAERIRDVVRARSARRAELAGVPLISPSVLFTDRAPRGDALVTGIPASGGRATGPVRVIRDAAEFGLLRSGDVLVCPYTNPAWTPLFQRASAVVVDTGGIGSHAAIVAREYGIPAVMATVTGTGELADGQVVTVDGGTGQVTAAAEPASGRLAG